MVSSFSRDRSHEKDGGHTNRSAVVENKNLMLHANLMAQSFIEPELWAIEVYIAGMGILDAFDSCDLDLDPMTFIHELTRIVWRYTGCANVNFLSSRLSKVIV